ncbi:hypothetical protein P5V15_004893 [Pogonomyrmex californicus]
MKNLEIGIETTSINKYNRNFLMLSKNDSYVRGTRVFTYTRLLSNFPRFDIESSLSIFPYTFERTHRWPDIFDEVDEQIKKHAGLQANCVGGGRIEHDPDEKTIKVYGYSQGFGKADHDVSVELLKKKYPTYNITCSNEGY